ncbi:oxidoreductase family protein [Alteromonas sp. CI.11.F.A3]|uniref:oxidoreductase family protein n=1 Tax=Alteromonas sp. CI.11.F.A3 TaxID=3079555 RepID=UPI002942F4D9|nr:oxidoreductase family protein [Alteromonas sp. CI.11.F.A3]WOI36034.1 oxidoreductase family protein [Alteromonas sp. CI.11.F.A3]
MDKVKPSLIDWLARTTNKEVRSPTLIQSLWSGYGACFRATLFDNAENALTPVVAKCVQPSLEISHPKGWQSNTSHLRKCRSFEVEHYFYTYLQSSTNTDCLTPACLAAASGENNSSAHILVMDDLDHAGYTQRATSLSVKQAQTVLRWLAAFHARFMGIVDSNVWPEGTYWHLSTRQDEWQAMEDGPLKKEAGRLSTQLSSARFQTLLHGDAKVANFCFTPDFSQCGGVDFQYTGLGVGMKDVAYFIGSALSESDQRAHTTSSLDYYFDCLRSQLIGTQYESQYLEIEQEWRALYPTACADFNRFLAGWSPDHWKINGELTRQTNIALATLN